MLESLGREGEEKKKISPLDIEGSYWLPFGWPLSNSLFFVLKARVVYALWA